MKRTRKPNKNPYPKRLPSKMVDCDICGKSVRERGLSGHKQLVHQIIITPVKPAITQVDKVITPVKSAITQVDKVITQVNIPIHEWIPKDHEAARLQAERKNCDCSKHELVNHPYLKGWNEKLGIHIHIKQCSHCGRLEQLSEDEFYRRLG